MNEEKRISMEQFDEAVKKGLEELTADEELKGEMRVIVPLMGMMFASKMKRILFNDNKEEN